jgi:hypothetical protein
MSKQNYNAFVQSKGNNFIVARKITTVKDSTLEQRGNNLVPTKKLTCTAHQKLGNNLMKGSTLEQTLSNLVLTKKLSDHRFASHLYSRQRWITGICDGGESGWPDLEDGGVGGDHGEGGLDAGGGVGGGRGGNELALQVVGGGGGGLDLAGVLLGRPPTAGLPAHEGVHAHDETAARLVRGGGGFGVWQAGEDGP